jgi:hypothetical protein
MPNQVVSYSEIDTYRQCRLKHQLSYIENWRVPDGDEAEALARGTLFHSVMEAHFGLIKEVGRDIEPEDLFLAVAPLLYEEGTGNQTERQELVEWIYRGHVEKWLESDLSWKIEAVELPLTAPLGPGFDLSGTVDLLVHIPQYGGGLWIVDHKTCRDLPKQKDFDMEDQTGIYAYLLKQQGYDIRGALYNHARTYKLKRQMFLDERFVRTPTVRQDRELETLVREAYEIMHEAYEHHDRRLGQSWTGDPEREWAPYDAPRSPDGERCSWKCNFTEACLAGRKLGPERTRSFLEDIGMTQHDTKPGPTFNKVRS